MKKTILAALINSKKADMPAAQKVLNEYASITKTRLGIHDAAVDKKADCALLIIEMAGTAAQQNKFVNKLKRTRGVSAGKISLKG
jgi:hypothetical protein